MSSAWDELGGRAETYEEALARCEVLRPKAALTEQELAARIVEQRERMRRHDLHFSDDYIGGEEMTMVSRTLARQYGFWINEPDDGPAVGNDD